MRDAARQPVALAPAVDSRLTANLGIDAFCCGTDPRIQAGFSRHPFRPGSVVNPRWRERAWPAWKQAFEVPRR